MPYNLLLLPLVGGFLFLHMAYLFRFSAQRLDGYRLLVESAIAGLALACLGRLIVVLFSGTAIGNWIGPKWLRFAPFEYSDTASLALLLGPLLALALNLVIGREAAKDREIRLHGNALILLLHRAEQESRVLSVTLDSRKWYVGFVTESPSLDPQELYFRILPVISGYRDKDTLKTEKLLFYEDLQEEGVDPAGFVITLPLKDVKIANFYATEI